MSPRDQGGRNAPMGQRARGRRTRGMRKENLQGTVITLLIPGGVPYQLAEERRGRPKRSKGRHRDGAVHTPPPVVAEGAIVQTPEILLGPEPIPGNGFVDVTHHQTNDLLMEGGVLEGVGGRAHLPDSSQSGDSQEGPQTGGGGGGKLTRPKRKVVSKDQICGAGQLDA